MERFHPDRILMLVLGRVLSDLVVLELDRKSVSSVQRARDGFRFLLESILMDQLASGIFRTKTNFVSMYFFHKTD
jgi:hypothetical protein